MIPVDLQYVGLDKVDKGLNTISAGVRDLRPVFGAIGDDVRAAEVRLFAEAPWTPLSESYAEQKAREFGDKPTMRATDVLYKSLTEEGAPGNVNRVDEDSAEFGSSNPLAKIHQAGTDVLPARPVLVELNPDRAVTLAGEYVQDLIESAGFN